MNSMTRMGFNFSKEAIDKYKLTLNECFILNWFIENIDKETLTVDDDKFTKGIYSWVRYKDVIKDTAKYANIRNEVTMAKLFKSLLDKKILLKIDSGKDHVRKIYFKFCDGVQKELCN